jgi:hypothetical protein
MSQSATQSAATLPSSLMAIHGLMQRYGAVRRTHAQAMQPPGIVDDPLWTHDAAAEAASEVYEHLLAWHLSCPPADAWVSFAAPLRSLLDAVAGVLARQPSKTPIRLAVAIGLGLLAPAPMAVALMDAVALLIVDAIQQGATRIAVTTPPAPYPRLLIESPVFPSRELHDTLVSALHPWGYLRVTAEAGGWRVHVDANPEAIINRPITDTR